MPDSELLSSAAAARGPRTAAIRRTGGENAQQQLTRLWRRGTDFLGTDLAILGGAMTWLSERRLVSAISNGGGFGVIASGAMSAAALDEEIEATRTLTSRPFGVNLITLHPQLLDLVDVCVSQNVGHVVLAGGLPTAAAIARIKASPAKLLCFAPSLGVAKKLVRMGADALIIEGMEAGGHIGPVSTSVLAQEILPALPEVPVFVAGGIGRGEAIALYLRLGASGAQLGTRFVCAHESTAHPRFKQAFIRAAARDAIQSVQLDPRFPIIPVRAIANSGTESFIALQRQVIERFDAGEISRKDAQFEIELYWTGALRRAIIDGDVETGSLMAGQSVGMVTCEESTKQILDTLVDQAFASLSREMRRSEAAAATVEQADALV